MKGPATYSPFPGATAIVRQELLYGPATVDELADILPQIPKRTLQVVVHWLLQSTGQVKKAGCIPVLDYRRGRRNRYLYELTERGRFLAKKNLKDVNYNHLDRLL